MFATKDEVLHAMSLTSEELQQSLSQNNIFVSIINSVFIGFTGTCFVYEVTQKSVDTETKCNVYVLLKKDVFAKEHIFHAYV